MHDLIPWVVLPNAGLCRDRFYIGVAWELCEVEGGQLLGRLLLLGRATAFKNGKHAELWDGRMGCDYFF